MLAMLVGAAMLWNLYAAKAAVRKRGTRTCPNRKRLEEASGSARASTGCNHRPSGTSGGPCGPAGAIGGVCTCVPGGWTVGLFTRLRMSIPEAQQVPHLRAGLAPRRRVRLLKRLSDPDSLRRLNSFMLVKEAKPTPRVA